MGVLQAGGNITTHLQGLVFSVATDASRISEPAYLPLEVCC